MTTSFDHLFEVPSYTADEAPVACVVFEYGTPTDLRTAGGKFYRHAPNRSVHDSFDRVYSWIHDKAEAIRWAAESVGGLALIDGQVWSEVGEPVYEVATFGMGWNHGGTSLNARITVPGADLNARSNASVLDRDAAVALALELARDRHDDLSFERIQNADMIEVLIPEVFRLETLTVRRERAVAKARADVSAAAEAVRAAGPGELDEALRAVGAAAKAARDVLYSAGV